MIEIGAGSVQSWECDAMGHLNVQHYIGRAVESLASLGVALGLGPAYGRAQGAELVATDHHIRFLREMRPGAPFIITGGVVDTGKDQLRLYQEMRNTATGVISATFITEVALFDRVTRERRPLPASVAARAASLGVAVPEHGAPRGLVRTAPRPRPSWEEADRLGLVLTQQGAVGAGDCDGRGFLLTRAYMGRVSDAIPNLLARLRGEDRSHDDKTGGAALEYRFVYHATPREGDVLALRSGVKALGEKTMIWIHWLFDRETGQAVATAEAVAVTLDLVARKAVAMTDTARRAMERHLVPSLSV